MLRMSSALLRCTLEHEHNPHELVVQAERHHAVAMHRKDEELTAAVAFEPAQLATLREQVQDSHGRHTTKVGALRG